MTKPLRIAVEGNIGVGKSTLLPRLQASMPGRWEVLSERVDEDPTFQRLLSEFYADPNKQIELQSWITQRRLVEFRKLQSNPTHYIFERSFLGELVFCHANLLQHERPDGRFISFFFDVVGALKECRYDAIVYLRADPDTCYERIKYRARGAENSISYEYIRHLHNCYETHLPEAARVHGIPLVTVDWQNFGGAEGVAEQLQLSLDYYNIKMAG